MKVAKHSKISPAGRKNQLAASLSNYFFLVVDPATDQNYGHRETSDGNVVEGEYRVLLPDGRTQIVRSVPLPLYCLIKATPPISILFADIGLIMRLGMWQR